MITMKDIICERNPILRAVAEEMSIPITEEDRQLGENMLTLLRNSQNPVKAEELRLRGGVGLAAPQLGISERIIAVHVPSNDPESETPSLSTVMHNPRILSRSVQDVCLGEGGDCLSVDRGAPRYVIRHNKIIVSYFDMAGGEYRVRLKNYETIVAQHEADHINGIIFYNHINRENPLALEEDALIIE